LTVRRKVLVILAAAAGAMLGSLVRSGRLRDFESLHSTGALKAQETLGVIREVFNDDLGKLDKDNSDLSVYDGTYDNMPKPTRDFLHSLLGDISTGWQQQQDLNFLMLADSSGNIVVANGFDATVPEGVGVPPELMAHLASGDGLLKFRTPRDKVNGILLLPSGPVLVASRPTVHTNYDGPARGALVTARYLDAAEIGRLSEKTHLSLSIFRYDDPHPSSDVAEARAHLLAPGSTYVRYTDDQFIGGYIRINDIYGVPACVLRADVPRARCLGWMDFRWRKI
jgi:sensor domain CHASE-containing protein